MTLGHVWGELNQMEEAKSETGMEPKVHQVPALGEEAPKPVQRSVWKPKGDAGQRQVKSGQLWS